MWADFCLGNGIFPYISPSKSGLEDHSNIWISFGRTEGAAGRRESILLMDVFLLVERPYWMFSSITLLVIINLIRYDIKIMHNTFHHFQIWNNKQQIWDKTYRNSLQKYCSRVNSMCSVKLFWSGWFIYDEDLAMYSNHKTLIESWHIFPFDWSNPT